MHTVALSNQGKVFTWGCNDEGALGREGAENVPLEVANTLAIPVTDISAGDSHTIAYNTEINHVYIWGLYRVSSLNFPSKMNIFYWRLFKSNHLIILYATRTP